MFSLKTILAEIVGLFVDDARFALAVVVWTGLAWLVLPHLHAMGPWTGALLFLGLAYILVESALQCARG